MWQVTTPHWYQPDHGPERFMQGRAVVSDDDPAVARNPTYFTRLDPQPAPEAPPGDETPRRPARRRRGG
jgi:hypothetical protein